MIRGFYELENYSAARGATMLGRIEGKARRCADS